MRALTMLIATAALAGSTSGCSLRMLDRWDADVVHAADVSGPPDVAWQQLHESARGSGLLLSALRPQEGVIEFAWMTAAGDGAAYLDCAGAGAVGSATLRPRLTLVPTARGSRVEVSTLVHATAASGCRSNGAFESWLLQRLHVIAAGEGLSATSSTALPTPR